MKLTKVAQIAGFLGSGKTTTLIRLGKELSTNYGKKIGIIVNEVGEVDVDGSFIRDFGFEVKEIVQGCICCSLKGDLQSTLKTLYENYRPDIILIEPTGIAFPSKIKEIINGLTDIPLEQAPVIALVDAERFRKIFREMEHFLIKQIKEADIVAINKIDLIKSKWDIDLLKSALREINPSAYILSMSAKRGDGVDEIIDIILQSKMKAQSLIDDEDSVALSGMGRSSIKLSFRVHENVNEAKLKVVISEILNRIANVSLNSGSRLIGHIKAYLRCPSGSLKASLLDVKCGVDFAGNVKGLVKEGEITIYAIVKSLKDKLVERILESEVKKILPKYCFSFSIEDEHD
ncbi:MAG: GTP-binding protein [Nitrososphaerales archaeon]